MNQNDLIMLWVKQYVDKQLANVGTGGTGEGGISLEQVYPVGAVYISTVATDPATLFGFGTWERIKDRFLLSAGDIYAAGAIGGEAEHTLTVDEMPSHRHAMDFYRESWTDTVAQTTNSVQYGSYGKEKIRSAEQNTAATLTGGSQPHNNMPPYIAVYMWKRTA